MTKHDLDIAPDVSVSQHGPIHGPTKKGQDVIDMDVFEFEDSLRKKGLSGGTCEGYALDLPVGKSPYSCYPFALHDTLILLWDFKVKNGMMTLFA